MKHCVNVLSTIYMSSGHAVPAYQIDMSCPSTITRNFKDENPFMNLSQPIMQSRDLVQHASFLLQRYLISP
jgi:hypothetical protein